MTERRTTVVANDEDLALLAHEARERGISLGRALGEAVALRAEALRRERRPRVATFHAEGSIAEQIDGDEPAARPFRDR
jgi:hypothetical protein